MNGIVYRINLSLFSVNYRYAWAQLMAPYAAEFGFDFKNLKRGWNTGLALFIASVILKVMWFGSWIVGLLYTFRWSRAYRPPTKPQKKTIMQVDPRHMATHGDVIAYDEGTFHGSHTVGFLPRPCVYKCRWALRSDPDYRNPEHFQTWSGDRTYHCSYLARCLPCYDHFCKFLRVAVYLDTMKSYFCLQLWLLLDTLFTISVSIASLSTSNHWISLIGFYATVLVTGVVICYLAVDNLLWNIRRLLWKNKLGAETRFGWAGDDAWALAFKVRTHGPEGEWVLHFHKFEENPWDLGPRENLRHVLGPWWQWPFFWIQPPRVSRYGHYAGWE
ncbi:hypothetical protein GGS20DRAFT_580453 [Poronia punctata]|nr:hypothetical protein GGS20DRAFT_580453 [Poronia punctata]